MASITIRNLEDSVKAKLRVRAAKHGRSMEAEAREILKAGLAPEGPRRNLYDQIRSIFEPLGGMELEIPPRTEPVRPPPNFE